MVARGKDPLAAVLSIVELIGPSQFSHWGEDGEPVGKPHPDAYVQVTAVSESQTENTRDVFPGLIPTRTRIAFNMDVQKEIIYANGGKQKLRTMSANFRSAEGGRVTFCIANETHHWTPGQRGPQFYNVLTNNLTKVKGRLLCITNAYEPGEDSVAQQIREEQEKVWAGIAEESGWLYDSLEAHPDAPLTKDWAPYIVDTIRGDAIWLDVEDIVQEIQDGSKTVASKRRMWFNQIVSAGDSLITVGQWDGILQPGCWGDKRDLKPGDQIVLGFDMRANKQIIAQTTEAFVGSIVDGRLRQNGDKLMRNHVLNTKRRTNAFGLYFGKESESSFRKIDAFAAAFLAYMALVKLAESGKKLPKEYTRKLYQF